MKTLFRQGIIRYQTAANGTPVFLQKDTLSGQYIDLNVDTDPTVITFAHGTSNYTIEETAYVSKAWGPFQPVGQTQYLYWDVSLITGLLTRSFTLLAPIYGTIAPNTPTVDQHWFDKTVNMMKVWNGTTWVVKLRVFAGTYDSNAVIIPSVIGSQVGLNSPDVSGFILFDDHLKPLRKTSQEFMTTETGFQTLSAQNNSYSSMAFETLAIYVAATEYIPKFHCVSLIADSKIALGSSDRTDRLIDGLVREDLYPTEVSRIYTSGVVVNDNWNFASTDIGKPLFCGQFGDVTTTPPVAGVVQMIGYVVSRTSICLDIKSPIYY